MKHPHLAAARQRRPRPPGSTEAQTADLDLKCARFMEECRRRNIRVTVQRVAVFRAVVEDNSHPTADTVRRRVLARSSPLSPATVYRTLEFLVGTGLLRRVSTPQSVSRFDANLDPHQHLVCRGCGRLQDWYETALHRVRLPRTTAAGFRAEALDIRIVGLCAACADGSHDGKTRRRET